MKGSNEDGTLEVRGRHSEEKEGAVSKESRQILKSESWCVQLEKARKNIAHSHLG